jgi:hypothetical protein
VGPPPTIATYLIASGLNAKTIATYMGHSSVVSTPPPKTAQSFPSAVEFVGPEGDSYVHVHIGPSSSPCVKLARGSARQSVWASGGPPPRPWAPSLTQSP